MRDFQESFLFSCQSKREDNLLFAAFVIGIKSEDVQVDQCLCLPFFRIYERKKNALIKEKQ
jgi:hypothetical protein